MSNEQVKVCNKCRQEKSLSEFHKDKYSNDRYTTICKECRNNKNNKIRHTPIGVINQIYNHQKECSIKRGHPKPNYTREELIDWILSQDNWEELYNKWVSSNYLKKLKPSIDRLDNNKGYSFDNIELVDWQENHKRQSKELKEGIGGRNRVVLQFSLKGVFIKEYINAEQASKETNTNKTSLCTVARSLGGSNEKRNRIQANNFLWIYKDLYSEDKILKVVNLLNDKVIIRFDTNGKLIDEFTSCREASKILGYSYSSIQSNLNMKSLSSHGYIWIKKKDYSEALLQKRLDKVKQNLRNN